jgi:hypothetical protein
MQLLGVNKQINAINFFIVAKIFPDQFVELKGPEVSKPNSSVKDAASLRAIYFIVRLLRQM